MNNIRAILTTCTVLILVGCNTVSKEYNKTGVTHGTVQLHLEKGKTTQAEDGIRDAQESRGLGDVYKRQAI